MEVEIRNYRDERHELAIGDSYIVGRSGRNVVLSNTRDKGEGIFTLLDCNLAVRYVSKEHVRIDVNASGRVTLTDLGSRYGTYLRPETVTDITTSLPTPSETDRMIRATLEARPGTRVVALGKACDFAISMS